MKEVLIAAMVAAGLAVSGAANASEALAKSNGCMTCHDLATKKVGPSFKDVAAKYKGKADAEATLAGNLRAAKGHPAVKSSEADTKALVAWVLKM